MVLILLGSWLSDVEMLNGESRTWFLKSSSKGWSFEKKNGTTSHGKVHRFLSREIVASHICSQHLPALLPPMWICLPFYQPAIAPPIPSVHLCFFLASEGKAHGRGANSKGFTTAAVQFDWSIHHLQDGKA